MVGPTKVWERLYVGGLGDAEELASYNTNHISAVVSLCGERIQEQLPDMHYVHIPIDDSRPIPTEAFDAVIDAITEGAQRGRVLIHCMSGMSRAPIMAAAWLHLAGVQNIEVALREIASRRRIVDPSPVLLASVKELLR